MGGRASCWLLNSSPAGWGLCRWGRCQRGSRGPAAQAVGCVVKRQMAAAALYALAPARRRCEWKHQVAAAPCPAAASALLQQRRTCAVEPSSQMAFVTSGLRRRAAALSAQRLSSAPTRRQKARFGWVQACGTWRMRSSLGHRALNADLEGEGLAGCTCMVGGVHELGGAAQAKQLCPNAPCGRRSAGRRRQLSRCRPHLPRGARSTGLLEILGALDAWGPWQASAAQCVASRRVGRGIHGSRLRTCARARSMGADKLIVSCRLIPADVAPREAGQPAGIRYAELSRGFAAALLLRGISQCPS
jgi:hypothetical protein